MEWRRWLAYRDAFPLEILCLNCEILSKLSCCSFFKTSGNANSDSVYSWSTVFLLHNELFTWNEMTCWFLGILNTLGVCTKIKNQEKLSFPVICSSQKTDFFLEHFLGGTSFSFHTFCLVLHANGTMKKNNYILFLNSFSFSSLSLSLLFLFFFLPSSLSLN